MIPNANDEREPVLGLQSLLEETLTYPVDLPEVREHLGTTVVAAPNVDDSMTLNEVLEHQLSNETFASADDLFLTILNALPERYVGRKFQSGRGIVIDENYEPDSDHTHHSF